MRLNRALRRWLRREPPARAHGAEPRRRGRVDHVLVFDGTMSTLEAGQETNAGLAYKLLAERGKVAGLSLYYEAGIQWEEWRRAPDVIMGRGIDRQIIRERHYKLTAEGSRAWDGSRDFYLDAIRGFEGREGLAGA